MNDGAMLTALKVNLGIVTTVYDARLTQLLQVAESYLISEGASTLNTADIGDAELVIMYAAWLWRRRDTMSGMPRMLELARNNRVFREKMV